jgi:hypothetical protein
MADQAVASASECEKHHRTLTKELNMVALAVRAETSLFDGLPPVHPGTCDTEWAARLPVMRSFPRLAVERDEEPVVEARFEEDPERWDGMA